MWYIVHYRNEALDKFASRACISWSEASIMQMLLYWYTTNYSCVNVKGILSIALEKNQQTNIDGNRRSKHLTHITRELCDSSVSLSLHWLPPHISTCFVHCFSPVKVRLALLAWCSLSFWFSSSRMEMEWKQAFIHIFF